MGSSESSCRSHCVVRNRLGYIATIAATKLPDERRQTDRDEGKVALDQAFITMEIPHGAEQKIEAPFADSRGLCLAIDLGTKLGSKVVCVPQGTTLMLRMFQDGEVALRIFRTGETGSEAAQEVFGIDPLVLLGLRTTTENSASAPSSTSQVKPTNSRPDVVNSQPGSPEVQVSTTSSAPFTTDVAENGALQGSELTACSSKAAISRDDPTCSKHPKTTSSDPVLELPHERRCPISHEVFVDPVLASDGFTYERACIEQWWKRSGPISPMTGKALDSSSLTPNLALRSICSDPLLHSGSNNSSSHLKLQEGSKRQMFYKAHEQALVEMFAGTLSTANVTGVCRRLEEEGVLDLDACVRRLLSLSGENSNGKQVTTAAVSLAPVCCSSGLANGNEAMSLLDQQIAVPVSWSEEQETVFAQLLDIGVPAVRARKAVDCEGADLEESVRWLERHQDDADVDTPDEVLREREIVELATKVLRMMTVPAIHRWSCLMALHQILGRILADPSSERVRKLRVQNPRFHHRVGRFPQAMELLSSIGFTKGDYWVSAFQREDCLEWKLPVGSSNPASERFERAYSLLDEVIRAPEEWLPFVSSDVQEEVPCPQSKTSLANSDEADEEFPTIHLSPPSDTQARREFLAKVHEYRARDPRRFQEAMRAAGRKPNPSVVDFRQRKQEEVDAFEAQALTSLATSSSSSSTPTGYRRLSERFGGRREFNLKDIETMRIEDAIADTPQYAQQYWASKGPSQSYSDVLTRSYDPGYLGRVALDKTNIFRSSEKIPPLRWCQGISDVAQRHAQQMAKGEMPFSHKGFDDRVRQYPIPYMTAAENLAYNAGCADTAGQAVDGWIKSPGHRKNLLGAFDLCGIGVAQSAGGEFFYTQLFARSLTGPLC